MVNDVSSEVAGLISGSKVFGSSENIRHGKFIFLIKRIFAQKVEVEGGQHKMAFWELTPIKSETNPQIEGDHVDYPGTAGPLKDDGMHPNPVGSNCALKVDFDGPGGRSAGSNIKAAVLALFNKRDGEVPDAEINKTWIDLSRQVPLKVGDAIGIDQATNQVILAKEAKQANPACGMLIGCTTVARKKRTTNDKGAYVTKLNWFCVAPMGTGENSNELVAKRRAEIEASMPIDDEEETGTAATPPAPTGMVSVPTNGYAPAPSNGTVAAPPPPAPVAPPPPAVAAPFTPPAPWRVHPTAPAGSTPETRWFWDGAAGVVNETMLRAQLGK